MNYLYTTFEDYIRGTLSDKEQVELEQLMESDKKVKEDFKLFQFMRKTLRSKIENQQSKEQLKSQLSEIGSKYFKASDHTSDDLGVKGKSFKSYIMSIAASLVFLAVAGIGLKQYANQNYSTPAIVDMLSQDLPEPGSRSIGNIDAGMKEFSTGLDYFYDKQYDQAIAQFKGIAQNSEQYEYAQLYMAESFLRKGDLDESINYARNLIVLENSIFKSEASFILAKAYLTMGDKDQAVNVLEELNQSADPILKNYVNGVISKMEGVMFKIAAF